MAAPAGEPETERYRRRFSAGTTLYCTGAPATELHLIGEGRDKGPLELPPLELSTRTALALDQVKAVIAELCDRGYLSVGVQTITIGDPFELRQLHALPA